MLLASAINTYLGKSFSIGHLSNKALASSTQQFIESEIRLILLSDHAQYQSSQPVEPLVNQAFSSCHQR